MVVENIEIRRKYNLLSCREKIQVLIGEDEMIPACFMFCFLGIESY